MTFKTFLPFVATVQHFDLEDKRVSPLRGLHSPNVTPSINAIVTLFGLKGAYFTLIAVFKLKTIKNHKN